MPSLFRYDKPRGVIKRIGCDAETHRRLVDMGLIGAVFGVKVRRKGGALVDYGDFSAVTRNDLAAEIEVGEVSEK